MKKRNDDSQNHITSAKDSVNKKQEFCPISESDISELGDSICTLVDQARAGCGDSRSELMQQQQNYMEIVAAPRMNPTFQAKFGQSDVVQQSIAVAIDLVTSEASPRESFLVG